MRECWCLSVSEARRAPVDGRWRASAGQVAEAEQITGEPRAAMGVEPTGSPRTSRRRATQPAAKRQRYPWLATAMMVEVPPLIEKALGCCPHVPSVTR